MAVAREPMQLFSPLECQSNRSPVDLLHGIRSRHRRRSIANAIARPPKRSIADTRAGPTKSLAPRLTSWPSLEGQRNRSLADALHRHRLSTKAIAHPPTHSITLARAPTKSLARRHTPSPSPWIKRLCQGEDGNAVGRRRDRWRRSRPKRCRPPPTTTLSAAPPRIRSTSKPPPHRHHSMTITDKNNNGRRMGELSIFQWKSQWSSTDL